jgi:hypothetical protein
MAKIKYAETLKPGFYLSSDRCVYATGTTKGNKWIYLAAKEPRWNGLMWNCFEPLEEATYSETNPTQFKVK